ncbi:hypothetical protein Goshw_018865 [Gossypium schwendimanii]|uniref:AAA+ ATPase domain-containing protein n=1 Tax=Gossypium schwendimanii TaxID=34291 RepID=A0A7J9LP36_GOSSC|nr:hypothetical protein [Gossypium schwendimanii]
MEFVSGFKRCMLKPDSKIQNLKDQIANLRYQRDMVKHFIVAAKENGREFDQDSMIWVYRAEEKIKEEEETVKNLEAQAKKRCFLGLCPNLKSVNLLNKKAEEDAQAVLELIQQAKPHKFNIEIKVQNLEDQPEADKRNVEVEPEKQISDKAKTVMEVEAKVSGSAKADTTKAMSKRIEQRRFDRGLYPGDTQESKSRPIQGFEAFESRKATLENIVEALKDPDLKIIGVNGRPGVGKTMLVKEAARRAREENMFDEVVMVTVSWNPNIKRIQREIADALGLKLDEETVFARAMRLQQWLKKQDKRVLLILDDIWDGQRLELEQVGIAIEGDHSIASEEDLGRPLMQNISENGFQKFSAVRFKILLTSTSGQVLIDMKTEEIFDVHVLTDEEAMGWIQKVVGNAANQPGYQQLLTQVVKNCAGFPVAISAIAIALRTQNFNHLVEALRKETKPIAKKEEALKSVYLTIEWSYSMLENPQLQSFFQLCALLPQGSDIHVSDLLRYNSGLRIASNVSTLEEAKKCLNKLKDAGLLLSSDNNEVVKMHDIVRDVAIWIASEEKRMFVIEDENRIEELLKERKLSSCTAISLPYSSNNKLPDNLECPRLKLLVLFNKNPSLEVPDNFFERMSELLILDFTGMDFASLPSSFTSLRNLQRLRFDECKLNDIAIVGKLKQLDTLKILSSDIQRLPQEIGGLTRLKSLDLSNCSKLKVIPEKIISGLPYLEELLMRNSFDQWGVEGNASLSELKSLSGLIALDVHIHSVQLMPAELFSEKLNRYKILIGEVWDWSRKYEKERTLKLQLTKGIHLDRGIKLLLHKTEDLYLDEMQGIKNLMYELDGTGFPQLENLYIQNGPELLFIINSMEVASRKAFPILKSLVLQNLINLEKICQGKLEEECFNRLQIISVERCDRLKNLFPFSMTKMLVQLQEIKVSKCKSIEEIVSEEREQNAGIATNKTEFGQLRSLTLKLLPELRSFCSKEKSRSIYQLEPVNTWSWLLFDGKVVLPVLEKLQLSCINIERLWLKSSYYSQNLTSLAIEGCGNLKHLFSPSITRCLLRLKSFEIIDCKCIREIIVPDEVKEKEKETETKEKVKEEEKEKEEIDKILFPQLNSLKMINLVNLVGFCSESCFLEFPSLKLLEIENCPRLKEFMHKPQSTDITTVIGTLEINKENDHHLGEQALFNAKVAFPKLEKLKISRLETVKIWHGQLHTDSFSKLKEMKVGYCNDILTIFPSIKEWNFQGLETLIVFNCDSLQHIFESSDIKVGTQLRRLYVSHLPKLEHVCNEDSQSNLTFENIRNVYVQDCWCLKSLFPASVAKGLKQLVDLTIDSCGLEVVISEGKVQNQDVNEFEFPEVCSLTLQNLPELKCFYPAEYEAKWPKLKKLKTYHCGQEVLGMEEHQSSNQKPLFFFEKVIHDLEELSLNSKHISVIRNHPFQVGIFSRIKVLQVLGYHDKPVVFLFNLLEKFNNLKKLELIHCDFKGNFIDEGDASEKKTERETVSLLNTGYIGEQNSQLPHVVLNLEALEFRRCDGSISLGLYLSSFQNLIILDLWQCKATALITSSVARNLVQLIKMRIRDCIMVREIVAKEKDDAKDLGVLSTPRLHRVRLSEKDYKGFWAGELNATISQLHKNTVRYYEQEHLKLHEFPELEEIWNTVPRGIINFKRLKCLEVYVCNNLRYMLTVSMAADLVQLQQIKVKNCKVIEEIIRDDKSTTMKIIFPQLKTITIKSCLGLSWFSSGSFALECPNLKEITLVGCPKMVAFASTDSNELHNEIIGGEYSNILVKDASTVSAKPFFSNKVSLPLLKDLTIVDMGNLERIWDDQLEMNSFSKLKHLEVHSCVKLSNIFPLNMLERLQRLKNLQVMECASLEELFEHKFNEAEINTKFVFPQMTYLNLSMLPKLKSFYSGVHTTEWPLLKKLDVYGCDKVEIFASEYSSCHETRGQHPLFWINMGTFPCLEELRLESNGNMKEIWHGQLPEGYFKLKVLELINSPPLTVLPPYFFRSLSNLQNFVLSDASINEIFPYEEPGGDEKLEGARAQLSVLRLSKLHELTHFWKENFKPGAIFCNMRVLEVQDCGKLNVLVPPSVSFENLTTLEVSGCEGLEHLFAHSTAKSLVQLSRMSVTDCKMLEEIVTCPGDEVKEAIVFTQLKYLGLSCLPNIESFCSGNCTFEFPSLETVTMRHCPKMKTSPWERFIAPKLKRVYSRKAGGEGHWEGDQNTTIQLLFMETVEYRGIEYVVLSDSSKLMEIRNWNPQGILDFKNLKFLKVHNCRNLRCPFNPSMAMDLVHLEKLEIHDCEMLEEVIIRKGLPKRERMSKKMFPKLVTLLLISLPNLTRFYSGNYLEFPFLKELWIQSCPMLNTFISGSVTRNNSRQNIHTDLTVLIDEKVAFPSLEKLGIMDMGSLRKIYNDQISMDSFSKLKVLKLIGLSKQLDILPSGFFLSLSKLERLVVDDASFTEIFQCKSTEKKMQAWELDSFSDLRLSKLPELLHLWKEEFECQPGTHFRNLRSLKVLECSKLKNLVPSTASFQNLTTLEISRCHGLRNLVTPSTAKSMVQLKRMRITDCKMLEGIVADADDRSIYSIMFKHLEYLRLQSLQALTSFCSGNYRFEFPSLVELVAIECPKFSVFCKGKVSTPLLKRVCPTEGGDRSFTDKDLNSTINVLYSEKVHTYLSNFLMIYSFRHLSI